jgi:lysophospholipase L1-like esterase
MLIAAVQELKAVSDETFVLRDIFNPAALAPLPPAQVARRRAVAERIARQGGAPLLDLNDGSVVASDFGDQTHLNPLAAERFSSLLAERLRPRGQENHASR